MILCNWSYFFVLVSLPQALFSLVISEESHIKQVMSRECSGPYSPNCMKLGLLRILSKAGDGEVALFPGISLSWVRPDLQLEQNQLQDSQTLDSVLINHLADLLSNLTLSVRVVNKETPLALANALLSQTPVATGRRKDRYGGALAAAGLMSGGTMVAVAMSGLAAMAGKALMASLLALMLSAISALRGNGDGDSKNTYEIVAKPVVSHQHTHSSEVIHGGHDYKRSIAAQDLVYRMHSRK
uniref:Unkown protein n=1 Tax=Riptortus pedestris TaxID=329032 RepID=R4WKJ1_RIPPE|nr:unkown protein [Riptortus pedestris]